MSNNGLVTKTLNGVAMVSCLFVAGCNEQPRASAEGMQHSEPAHSGWKLIWQDEFESRSLDPGKWSHNVDCAGGGNHELQCYTDRQENLFIEDGVLHIVAREESHSGPKYGENDSRYDRADTSKTSEFTSARIHTKSKLNLRYGRVDVRAKVAGGQGMWSAVWMLPDDNVYGTWPASGEIDILEALNPGTADNLIYGSLHYGLPWPQWENKFGVAPMQSNPADDFHVYSMEWEADEVRWYLDGRHYQTQRSSGWYNYVWKGQQKGFEVAHLRAPFDQWFHLIMNLAVGGDWPGAPDSNWATSREMLVDYVRVYQCDSENSDSEGYTGEGCATIDPEIVENSDSGAPGTRDYTLYSDGPSKLTFAVESGEVINVLQPGHLPATTVSQHSDSGWDIHFSENGEAFLTSMSESVIAGYESELMLGGGAGWYKNGQIEFDLYVREATPGSTLAVSLGAINNRSAAVDIELPPAGTKQRVAVRIAEIYGSSRAQGKEIDLGEIVKPFILEYQGGGLQIEVNNISLQCAFNREPEAWQTDQTCGIGPRQTPQEPVLVRFNDIQWSAWDCCGSGTFAERDDRQAGRKAVEFEYGATPTVIGFQAPALVDLGAFAGGTLEFDFRQVTAPPEGAVWYVKLEAEASAGQALLTDGGPEPTEHWQHYAFPLSGELAGAELENIKNVLVFPSWGNADGAVMRIDNLRFVMP